jgi:hypothetical protein
MKAIDYLRHPSNGLIVTLCGSNKFFEEYMEAARQLTFMGHIVLTCGSFGHSYHKGKEIGKTQEEFMTVKKLHFMKILHSQLVVVVSDESGYMGSSTVAEIEFARLHLIDVVDFDGKTFTGEVNSGLVDQFSYYRKVLNAYAENHNLGY